MRSPLIVASAVQPGDRRMITSILAFHLPQHLHLVPVHVLLDHVDEERSQRARPDRVDVDGVAVEPLGAVVLHLALGRHCLQGPPLDLPREDRHR